MIRSNAADRISRLLNRAAVDVRAQAETYGYFIVTILGFSFWFLMVVPFASHRESYSWLAGIHTESFAQQFSFGLSSTYRPLAQVVTRLGFLVLDPRVFPTSVLRETLLQGLIYGVFIFAWWLIYSAAPQRRLFALVACVTGGVFFASYVHLFHIYGMFYVPVIVTLGSLIYFRASNTFQRQEVWFAAAATVLAFWHPFATALFVGFYFGFYLDNFRRRDRAQHVQAIIILFVGMMAIAALVAFFPRTPMPVPTRLLGFLVSYRTNEVNRVTSFVAFLLTQTVVFSMDLSPRVKMGAFLFASVLSLVFVLEGIPLLLLWICAVLVKLLRLRYWSLFFLALTAALLPFGGGIGSPSYALFAIIVAVYVTPLGWLQAEESMSFIRTRYLMATISAVAIILLSIRMGIEVPIVTKAANPLLTERERTYQLEHILDWLHNSDYCGYGITFAEDAGSPIDSVESAIERRNRPPAALGDVQLFWRTVLQCQKPENASTSETVIVTFGGPRLADLTPAFEVKGRYAGDATVWVRDSGR